MQQGVTFWLFEEQANIFKESGQICFVFLTNLLKESGPTKLLAIYFVSAKDYFERRSYDVGMKMVSDHYWL